MGPFGFPDTHPRPVLQGVPHSSPRNEPNGDPYRHKHGHQYCEDGQGEGHYGQWIYDLVRDAEEGDLEIEYPCREYEAEYDARHHTDDTYHKSQGHIGTGYLPLGVPEGHEHPYIPGIALHQPYHCHEY